MVLVLLVLGVVIQCQEVRAIGLPLGSRDVLDPHAGDFGPSSNIQPEDYLLNLTLHRYPSFKHKFFIDYSNGSPESGSDTPLDTTGMINTVTAAIPEFPSVLILPMFMVVTMLGIIVCKMKRTI
jgi:hypothetical protein